MAALLKCEDDAFFLRGGEPREDVVVFCKDSQFVFTHPDELVAGNDFAEFEFHVFADLFCDERVVTGEDFRRDAVVFE